MIFAQLQYETSYSDFHPDLEAFLRTRFSSTQSGLQGDSWIWIFEGEERVEVDTFSAMKHQVKSAKAGQLVEKVIAALMLKYRVTVYDKPELEAHEDG